MTVLNIVPKPNSLLTTKLEAFNFKDPPTDPIQLAKDLTETMLSHDGLGLSANQIGLPYRVFVVKSNPILCCYNAKIVDFGDETSDYEEGCLSFPGIFIKVIRPVNIRIRYTQPNGNTDTYKYAGLTSRVIQHEYDHMEGIRFTDHVGNVRLQMAVKKAARDGHPYLMKDFK